MLRFLLPQDTPLRERRFIVGVVIAAMVLAALPGLLIAAGSSPGSSYLGYAYNTDDHMVYSAWMWQAMHGHLLFDNRFTNAPQPGLTIHLYFLALGWIAKLIGIAASANLARIAFSGLFVLLLYRMVRESRWGDHATKLAVIFPIISGGIGFMTWQMFGQDIDRPTPDLLRQLLLGHLPTDVWQPEVYVYPSMLTNGLFMVSLCLITVVFLAVLEAKESSRAVLPGALAMFVLMNIHSYDVLLIALVLVGFLVAQSSTKAVSKPWVLRSLMIGCGAIPSALWFVYVLGHDPVFQARAATLTYSPNFRQLFFGLIFPLVTGVSTLIVCRSSDPNAQRRQFAGTALVVMTYVVLFVTSATHGSGYFMGVPAWSGLFAVTLLSIGLLAGESSATNLFISWALVGMVAIYFPALFQRKLAMGLVVPWGILAACGTSKLLLAQERSARNLITALAIILFGGSSFRWAARELAFSKADVSNTSVHPIHLNANERQILDKLGDMDGRHVLIAPPGVPSATFASHDQESAPFTELAPRVPDLNPIVSGLTGVYTFAGHWSETPDYNRKRNLLSRIFYGNESQQERLAMIGATGADLIIAPNPEAFPVPFDLSNLGRVVIDGPQFRLISLK